MEFFESAKTVRLKGHHSKYLLAAADGEQVYQDRDGSSRNARWSVEFVKGSPTVLRLRSCYGRYLTPSREPFLLGITGRKVLQTLPRHLDSSVEWVPARDGSRVRLGTRHGQLLRANSGLPPGRNSITHDGAPHLQSSAQDWVLWNVEMVKLRQRLPEERLNRPTLVADASPVSTLMPRLSIDESSSSLGGSPHKSDGRTIYYAVAEDDGTVDNSGEDSFSFKGTSVAELREKLEEETALSGIIVCSRNPLNGKLCPLRLHLPPNNTTMHIVVVQASSKVAKSFNKP